MQALIGFLITHGYLVVFLWVLAGQAGVPVPDGPLLLAAGALAGAGNLSLWLLVALSVAASLISDCAWFLLGRRHGVRVLAILCKISLEPDSCVRRTQIAFASRGSLTLLMSKFVPGLGLVAPPLAGMTRMPFTRFLVLDGVASLVWSVAFLLPGYLLHDQLEALADRFATTGAWLLAMFGGVVVGWIVWRWSLRRRFLRELQMARISPLDLHRLMQDGGEVFVVDLRHDGDVEYDPFIVPGALRLTTETLDDRHAEIPRDRDVVLYCS